MRPTQRGAKLIGASAALILLAALYRDPILTAISILLLSTLALDALSARLRARKASEIPVKPPTSHLRIKAGETRELELEAQTPVEMEIGSEGWYTASQTPSKNSIVVRVNPQLSGIYKLEHLKAKVKGRLGLITTDMSLPLNLEVKAYPRVLPWIVEAARILRAGLAGPGLAPGRRPGQGTEYHGTREYTPGDPLRLVEWKATARLSKLMVKEYLEELYSSPHIIYDERSPGPITADELAEMFLSSIVGAASTGTPIGLTIKPGKESELHWESLDPTEALEIALAHTLERIEAEAGSIYELLDPRPARALIKTLEKAREKGVAEILRASRERRLNTQLKIMVKNPTPTLDLTYIGHLLYDASSLIELAEEARLRGHRLRVQTPPKPWRDSKSLEEAYITHTSYKRIINSLQRIGAELSLGASTKTPPSQTAGCSASPWTH